MQLSTAEVKKESALSSGKISNSLERFIFDHVDSAGFLETLLLFHANPSNTWTPAQVATELRNNPNSIARHLQKLVQLKIIHETSSRGQEYIFDSTNSEIAPILFELSEHYRIQRHKIFELIYSPLKKARDFSGAFLLPNKGKGDGENG